jgi:predicted membrane chloride channel (bestrophin family)
MVMGPEVVLKSPVPLAVTVVVPAATPLRLPLFDDELPIGIVSVAGTVATPGALLVRFTLMALRASWLLE